MINSASRNIYYEREYTLLPKSSQGKNSVTPKYVGLLNRIQEILGAKNQVEVAEMLGVKPSSVTGWKQQGFVSVDTLLKVSKLRNASISWLLTGEGAKLNADATATRVKIEDEPGNEFVANVKNFLEDCEKLNPRDKEYILHHIEILHRKVEECIDKYESRSIKSASKEQINLEFSALMQLINKDYSDIDETTVLKVHARRLEGIDSETVRIVREYLVKYYGYDSTNDGNQEHQSIARTSGE